MKSLTKFERIRLLRQLGLNTQDDILVRSVEDWTRQQNWLQRFDSYTVRTFRPGPVLGREPYFAVISRSEFEAHWRDLLGQGWALVIAAGVDPKDALLAGTILRQNEVTEVDIVRGSGSVVRQVTHDGQIDSHFTIQEEGLTGNPLIDEALGKVRETERRWVRIDALRRVVYEFSYYRTKVGYKGEDVIFWEITGFNKMDEPGIDLEDLGEI